MRVLGYETKLCLWKEERKALVGGRSSLLALALPEAKPMRWMSVGYWLFKTVAANLPIHPIVAFCYLSGASECHGQGRNNGWYGTRWRLRKMLAIVLGHNTGWTEHARGCARSCE